MAIAKVKPIDTLRTVLEKARPSMAAVLPKHLTPDRLMKLALVACSRDAKLLSCSPGSVAQAVMSAAQMGLDCSGVLGSSYLVPFRTKSGKYEATLIVGYRGLIDLARRSGQIDSIEARVVYEADHFELAFGTDPVLVHRPSLDGDPGDPRLVYAVARIVGQAIPQVEVMTRTQVEAIRNASQSSGGPTWRNHWLEMARKTVVRRLCKYLPLSPEMVSAFDNEDTFEQGRPVVDLGDSFVEVPEEAPTGVAGLKASLGVGEAPEVEAPAEEVAP